MVVRTVLGKIKSNEPSEMWIPDDPGFLLAFGEYIAHVYIMIQFEIRSC